MVAKEEAVEEEDVSIGGCCAVHRPSMDVGAEQVAMEEDNGRGGGGDRGGR